MCRWVCTATTSPPRVGVGREEQDAWALRSHQRAIAAIDCGRFGEEIVPVEIADKKGTTIVEHDEAPRRDTSLEALAKLKPAFSAEGTVTAGNAPGVNDGAAAVVVTSDGWARSEGTRNRLRRSSDRVQPPGVRHTSR